MKLSGKGVSRDFIRPGKGTNVFTAVKETDIILSSGKLTEIEGRSGSGKSTLLNMMAGLLAPTTGQVLLDETDLYALDDGKRARVRNEKIGVIPQGQTALRALTVQENVSLPVLMYGGTPDKERLEKLLDQVGILHLKDIYPDELSGGERRRLAIARALMMNPGIILADEPTSDLDDENTKTVLTILRNCADEGMAVLLVTHEKEAADFADRVYRMNDGILSK